MNKFYATLLIICASVFTANAQDWIEQFQSPKTSKSNENLWQMQKEFNDYWSNYDVKNGYYYIDGKKHKAGGWKQFKRWEWFWETRVDRETGNFPSVNTYRVQQDFLKVKNAKGEDLADWQSMGPSSSAGGYAGVGRINCVAFHPTNPNVFWVGAPSGGLWKTIDGGQSWEILTDNLPVIGVSEIVLAHDYETSKTMYIATGDRDAGDNYSIGVLKTTDDGQTWQETGFSLEVSSRYRITRMLIHPSDPNTFWASTNGGLIKTTNAWETFNVVSSGVFFDIELQPNSNGEVLYAANFSNKTILKSTNSGDTWLEVHSLPSSYRVELDVTPANPDVVYALACDTQYGLDGIYKSIDGGDTFNQIYGDQSTDYNLLNWDVSTSSGGQGWFDLTLSVSPTNENTVYVGGVNTWKSTNGGESWSIANHWYGGYSVPAVHADKHYMTFRDENTFFEANDGGIYKTTDGGQTWIDLTNGLVISQMYRLGVSQTVKDEVITGLQDNGSKLTSAGNWWDVKGGDGMECIIDYKDVNVQYATYVNGQIDRTLNRWNSRSNITANIPGGAQGAWVTPYLIDPIDNKTLYVGYADVWKTTDRGDNWEKISNLNITSKIRSMAIAESNPEYIYIADLYNIYRTNNGGEIWENITSSLPSNYNSITYITVDNIDPKHIWITSGGYINGQKVYESFDGGTTWDNISGTNLPNVPANTIIENKLSSGQQQLYLGTDIGVFLKEDNNEWILFSNNLPSVVVTELEIHYDLETPENSVLYASTYGRGLWKSGLAPFKSPALMVNQVDGPFYVSNEVAANHSIGYSINETFTENTFTVYLSDKNGDFSSAVAIGDLQTNEGGTIDFVIPAGTESGSDYRIKLVSSNPVYESEPSNSFSIVLDNEKPTVNISSGTGDNTQLSSFNVYVEFNENVKGFEQSDMQVTNADITEFDDITAPKYRVKIAPIASGTVSVSVPANVTTDIAGNSNTASNEWSTMYTVTSVNNVTTSGLSVYPNPSNGHITLNYDRPFEKITLSVYDITGKLLDTRSLHDANKASVDFSNLQKGMYILKIRIDDKEINSKMIIE
ncbi:T9SS type A sorting domain-containing protein [Perlabentimonas gracilis]|uniref:T9SS type A sorting domain-containing protein n=1 Tax=Perlabentimonas gracilis TaxID=2715279 RepID=UPI001407DF76|nr:T9SS type A sorting domain-containing protein [Perlabentimonas gracilis]NHB67135.1 T9SS type A sorting domain-containing protein [Perlabentimonas gracilis]